MRKSRYNESHIVQALKRAESGVALPHVCQVLGVSSANFYQWRSTNESLEASDLKEVRELEKGNRRVKHVDV